MTRRKLQDLSNVSMLELFRAEAENQTTILTNGLLELERGSPSAGSFEMLMRAAHSLKGAARIVNLQAAVRLAHALEDCFVVAQQGKLTLRQPETDVLFRGIDLLAQLARCTDADIANWETEHAAEISRFLTALAHLISGPRPGRARSAPGRADPASAPAVRPSPVEGSVPNNGAGSSPSLSSPAGAMVSSPQVPASEPLLGDGPAAGGALVGPSPGSAAAPVEVTSHPPAHRRPESSERVLRLTAENLNRLLALAGESLVESRWLRPFADSLQRLKRQQSDLARQLDSLRSSLEADQLSERTGNSLNLLVHQVAASQQFLADRLQELEMFDRRSAHLSQRLYLEVLRTRMRPFSDGVRRFPRMVRDLARSLGKEVTFEVLGETTQVDRDILERLETPLAHLLRNAVDHGCEPPDARLKGGKPTEASLRLEARHSAGVLLVTVTDDGIGVDLERVRQAIVNRNLASHAAVEKFTEAELLEFLFLPGFTLKEDVTEISGRGFGLDVVQNMVKSVRGSIRLANQPGRGLRVQLQLPLTLSVLRALLVEVAREPYAIPLNQISRTLKLPRGHVEALAGRPHFHLGGQPIGLLTAHQVLGCGEAKPAGDELAVVVLGDRANRYGVVVDRFLGERELVVQPLDARLGRVQDISAAALMEDGSPVLILDVEQMLHSMEKVVASGRLASLPGAPVDFATNRRKRVLAVDDSLTVRELERKLLTSRGYITDIAADGLEAWNAVRAGQYDLVITDVDMPHLSGVELADLIKKDPHLKSLPVLIVSYKDCEEDRLRGLAAGADYYLTKGSFHDESLLQAVVELIGEAVP